MNWIDLLPAAIGLVGTVLAWVAADARHKARLDMLQKAFDHQKDEQERQTTEQNNRLAHMDIKQHGSEQDRAELRRMIDRLEASKASREVVDGIRAEISMFKADMDKRFDRLERLLEERRG